MGGLKDRCCTAQAVAMAKVLQEPPEAPPAPPLETCTSVENTVLDVESPGRPNLTLRSNEVRKPTSPVALFGMQGRDPSC